MDMRLNWLYVRIAGLKLSKRGWKVIVPIVREGEYGDYHSIVWLCFYVIIGRDLYKLESDLDERRNIEYKRCA